MGLMDWLKGRSPTDPNVVAERLLDDLERVSGTWVWSLAQLADKPEIAALIATELPVAVAVVRTVCERIGRLSEKLGPADQGFDAMYANLVRVSGYPVGGRWIVRLLLLRTPPLTTDDFVFMFGQLGRIERLSCETVQFASALLDSMERVHAGSEISAPLRLQLGKFRNCFEWSVEAEDRRLSMRIAILLGEMEASPLEAGEAWSDAALASMNGRESERRSGWFELFAHCSTATSANPSGKWSKAARKLLEKKVTREDFREQMLAWFPRVNEPRTADSLHSTYIRAGAMTLTDAHMDILRGLAWMCGFAEDRELARALTALAISAFKKIPGIGPRATRVGNACITALGMMPGLDAVGQLALLKVKVKFGTAQKAIDKALNAAAEREGLPREELEEMAVPAYGLTEVGRLVETLGEFTAELAVAGAKSVAITWRRADGKVQKSLPAAVKKEFAEELKELSAAKKDIENMLPAQAERIDALFLQQKSWPLETWLARYLEHPLIGTLARRLIWNFTTGGVTTPGLWLDGKLADRRGQPVPLDAVQTRVTLWHPLAQPPDVVLGWRAFLEEWQIVQPFKQAHREVYLLTPAEERTRTYSNRFAAHILKQHQFHALAAARGWKNKLRLMVDDEYPPATRLLTQWGLRAEFWIEGAGDETNESGSYLYLSTDQVRFYRLEDAQLTAHAGGGGYGAGWHRPVVAEPLPLAEIPPLVFCEIMRDVDLFVGVASVGNDPAWADGGRRDAEHDAWALHAFGDLSATAQTRRELLQRLVPKLKIAGRCSFAEKFLVVRGDLRTYKIHLGSGNILMSPNDRYLCIVPGRGQPEDGKVFLPFEGDRTLSVILSKAFLLAADAKITDPSITAQIARLE